MRLTGWVIVGWMVSASAVAAAAAELKPGTVRAFDRYVALTEERMRAEVEGRSPFLWLDRLDPTESAEVLARLRSGEVVIERLRTRDGGEEVDVPSGMVHHWIGTVLIPGATLDRTIALVQDYDRYPEVYAPDVRASAIRSRAGDRFEVYLRLHTKKILTWVADTEHSVEFIPVGDSRMHVPSRSTRILEIEHPDTPRERAKPEGDDRGFAWRLNNYCSFEERDEGTLMQCESITLTRGIPFSARRRGPAVRDRRAPREADGHPRGGPAPSRGRLVMPAVSVTGTRLSRGVRSSSPAGKIPI